MTNSALRERTKIQLEGRAESVKINDSVNQNGQYEKSEVSFVLKDWTSPSERKPALPERLPVRTYARKRPPDFDGEQVKVAGSMGEEQYFEAESIYIPKMRYKIERKGTNWFAVAGAALLIIIIVLWFWYKDI